MLCNSYLLKFKYTFYMLTKKSRKHIYVYKTKHVRTSDFWFMLGKQQSDLIPFFLVIFFFSYYRCFSLKIVHNVSSKHVQYIFKIYIEGKIIECMYLVNVFTCRMYTIQRYINKTVTFR